MFSGNRSALIRTLSRVIFFGRDFFRRKPGMASLNGLVDAASEHALESRELQRELVESTMRCARDRKLSVYYVHDFLAEDMAQGRNPARQELLRIRQTAVEGGGGVFIDLQRTFADQIGVSWFSDFIHLSSVGQQKVAELLCTRME
jgi:hypothetical protein